MMTSRRRLGLLLISALCAAVFLNGTAVMTGRASALSSYNWPKEKKSAWHMTTLTKNQVKQVMHFDMPGGSYNQGATVTEKYYVFAVHFGDYNSRNFVRVADKKTGKKVKDVDTPSKWRHMNSIDYTWGAGEVVVNDGGCISMSSFKITSKSSCKSKQAPNYGAQKLTHQGDAEYKGEVFAMGWDAAKSNWGQTWTYRKHENALFVYDKKSKKLKRTFYIPKSVVYGESEDVAIDGNGDAFIFYNFQHVGGKGMGVYKISSSVIGSSPTDGGDSGGSGEGAVAPRPTAPEGQIQIEQDTEPECATILKKWCEISDGKVTITTILLFVIEMMSASVVTLGTAGLIICGYTIMTATDNEAKVTKAKVRIVGIIIGLVLWAIAALVINLIVPVVDDDVYGRMVSSSATEDKDYIE